MKGLWYNLRETTLCVSRGGVVEKSVVDFDHQR